MIRIVTSLGTERRTPEILCYSTPYTVRSVRYEARTERPWPGAREGRGKIEEAGTGGDEWWKLVFDLVSEFQCRLCVSAFVVL